MGLPPIRTLDDIRKLGEHVRERGFTALKTNIFLFDSGRPELYMRSPRTSAPSSTQFIPCRNHLQERPSNAPRNRSI